MRELYQSATAEGFPKKFLYAQVQALPQETLKGRNQGRDSN